MPGGIVKVGGTIFVYDNAFSASGLYYTFAEINTAFPNDFELAVGATTGLGAGTIRKQYISGVNLTIGGQAADGTNATTLQDSNCDVYFRTGNVLSYRNIPSVLKTQFGTKIASTAGGVSYVSGRDGVFIEQASGNLVYRGQFLMYGSESFVDSGNLQFLDSGASGASEMAGCIQRCGSSVGMVIGNNATANFDVYNTTFASTSTGTFVSAMSLRNTDNLIFACAAPASFFVSGAANMKVSNIQLIGAPTTSDIRWTGGGGTAWYIYQPQFSGSAIVPRFSGVGPPSSTPTQEFWYFNVKVCDPFGNPITGVPVRLSSDIDGNVVDTKTFGDGDIGFTHTDSGFSNGVRVRDHYGQVSYAFTDRTFTATINGYGGAFPPLAGYNTSIVKFEWPGRDVFQGAFQLNGGEFKACIMPVTLTPGMPLLATQWTERVAP